MQAAIREFRDSFKRGRLFGTIPGALIGAVTTTGISLIEENFSALDSLIAFVVLLVVAAGLFFLYCCLKTSKWFYYSGFIPAFQKPVPGKVDRFILFLSKGLEPLEHSDAALMRDIREWEKERRKILKRKRDEKRAQQKKRFF